MIISYVKRGRIYWTSLGLVVLIDVVEFFLVTHYVSLSLRKKLLISYQETVVSFSSQEITKISNRLSA